MVIRNIIRQLETPDRLRGRMTGVNMVFFMGGPQLGELEAGAVANWLGAPFSVVSGGIGCLVAHGLGRGDDAGAAPLPARGARDAEKPHMSPSHATDGSATWPAHVEPRTPSTHPRSTRSSSA